MTLPDNKYGIVILAAGNSSRLGRPKQLLSFRGKSLICHTVDEAVKVTGKHVIVVTGANKDLVETELINSPAHVIHNDYWQEGMSSSIYVGLITLLKLFPCLDGLIFTVCDQPFISSTIFEELISTKEQENKGIVAAAYGDSLGVPVLFDHQYFSELLKLEGKEGAKTLLKKFINNTESVPFVKGGIDIDTVQAYEDLIKSEMM